MALTFGWLICALAIGAPLGALVTRRLSVVRDWFFLFFYFQGLVYVHVVPMLYLTFPDVTSWSTVPGGQEPWLYVLMQLAVLVLFQWPMLLLYLRRRGAGTARLGSRTRVAMVPRRVLLLSLCATAFSLLFLYVMISSDMTRAMREYGNEQLPAVFVALPTFVFGIMRLFQVSGLFLSCCLLLVVLNRQALRRPVRAIVLVGFFVTAGVWMWFYLVNGTRSVPLLGLAALLGVLLSQRRVRMMGSGGKTWVMLFLTFCMALYLLRISYNIRFGYSQGGFTVGMLNPFDASYLDSMPSEGVNNPLFRLNGLDSIVQITPEALRQGYALGEAWVPLSYVSLMQWVDRDRVEALKLQRSTDPKMYLIYRYTPYDKSDWPNSILFDLYGNFSFPGFLIGAWVFSRLFGFAGSSLMFPRSGRSTLFGLFIVTGTIQFESTFGQWFFTLVNMLPVFAAVAILNPFSVVDPAVKSGSR